MTGKTFKALQLVESHLKAGIAPERIAYISFTKQASQVALQRAMRSFNLPEHRFPFFRTIHSLCFRQLGLRRERCMMWRSYRELGDILGLDFRDGRNIEDGADMYGMNTANRMKFLENLARLKQEPLVKTWELANDPEMEWFELERYARGLKEYKARRGLLDFTDILEMFLDDRKAVPKLDVLIVDEAQDTSSLGWDVLDRIIDATPVTYAMGDDDQAIFLFSGANVDRFLNLPGESVVLDQSYRVPSAIHPLAMRIASKIKRRQAKTWLPKVGEPGAYFYQPSMDHVDISKGNWLLLARNGYSLRQIEELCESEGFSFRSVGRSPLDNPSLKAIMVWEHMRRGNTVSLTDLRLLKPFMARRIVEQKDPGVRYSIGDVWPGEAPIWHEALNLINDNEREYYIAARKRGETLTKTPRITISTIHSVKGGEADNVLLLTDVSAKTMQTMINHPDDELRVTYVGVTRAAQTLHIVAPQTERFFEI